MINKMTKEEALKKVRGYLTDYLPLEDADEIDEIIEALELPIDKSAMMYEIYMTGEYQGCWVRFKDIEKIVNKYMGESEEE